MKNDSIGYHPVRCVARFLGKVWNVVWKKESKMSMKSLFGVRYTQRLITKPILM